MSHTHEYKVGMTCSGCSNAIGRILSKTEGVSSYTTDVATKLVTVTGTVDKQVVTDKLSKWASASGKSVEYIKTV